MKTILLILAFCTFSYSLYAQQEPKQKETPPSSFNETSSIAAVAMSRGHADLFMGTVTPVGEIESVFKTRFGYGLQGLYAVAPGFHAGAFFETSKGAIKNAENFSLRLNYYGLVGQYYMNPYFYFQMKAGLSTFKIDGSIAGTQYALGISESPFIAGIGFGFNVPVISAFSFSPFAEVIHSFRKGNDVEYVNEYTVMKVMGSFRYNF